jgi:ketosteroid isomerase-like protein
VDKDNNKDKDKDKKLARPPGLAPAQDSEGVPSLGPRNPALAEIYQRLYPEMRRPKPNQEAIAAALLAMQRLTLEADSETVAEDATQQTTINGLAPCPVCGHRNREGNQFCGACGLPLDPSPQSDSAPPAATNLSPSPQARDNNKNDKNNDKNNDEVHPAPGSAVGAHYYHHHYHHHYFQGGSADVAASTPRAGAPESAREADRMRIAAAAKGEPMSRNEAAVRRLTQEWVLACNTRQLEELIELYSTDALVLRSNLPPIRGAAAVREFFYSSLEAGLGEVAVDPTRVEVSGDMAYEVGRYSALVPGATGKRREERGKYLWVFAKQPSGDWKLVAECWSSDLTLTGAESDLPKTAIAPGKPRRN